MSCPPSIDPDEDHLTLLRAIDALSEGIAILDRETGTLVANDAYRKALGSSVSSDSAPGSAPAIEILASDGRCLSPEQWPGARALRGDFVQRLELTIRRRDNGEEFVAEFTTQPLRSATGRVQCVVSFHDVTDRRAQSAEIRRLTRLYATLSEVNQIIVRCASRAELFTEICRIGISFGKFGGVAIAWKYAADSAFVTVASAMQTPGLDLPGWSGCCEACLEGLSSGHPAICNDTCADSPGLGCHAALAECGYRSCGAYPLELNGMVRGALMLCSREPGFFSGPEARLLREVASNISFALEKLNRESERQRMLELVAEGGRLAKLGTWERNFSAGTAIWSREMYRLWGREPELGPVNFPDLPKHFTAESWTRLRALIDETLAKGMPFVCDAQLISAKGERLWLICRGEPLLDDEGRRVGVRGSIQDVTERKRAEIALEERETQVRLYAEHCPAAVAMLDEDLRYLVVSRRWIEEYQLEGVPIIGRTHYEIFPDIPERWKAIHERCLAGAVERNDADPFVRNDGSTSWIRWEVRPWRRADESIGGIMVCSEDITAMKRQIESTNLFRALIEHSTDGIYVADPLTAQFLDVNASGCGSLGYTREELIGRRAFEVVQGLTPDFFAEMNVQLRAEGHISVEIPHVRKDGTTFLGEANLSLVTLDRDYLLVMVRDVTAHRRAEQDLRTRTAFLEAMVESSRDAVLVVDEHMRILFRNGNFTRMFHVPAALAEATDDTLMLRHVAAQAKDPELFVARVTELFAHRGDVSLEEVELADGRILERFSAPVQDAAANYFGRIWSFRDITEGRRLEHQALRSQRLEAIGTLSNGIAHDLNNILTPVLMAAGLLGAEARTPRHAELLQLIESESQRGAKIIRQLLTFSRGLPGARAIVRLRPLILELLTLMRETFPRNIVLEEQAGTDLGAILGDATQLHQVLLNLCVNSRDAMPNGGALTIRAENLEVTPAIAAEHLGAKLGSHVLITISDTGEGIPAEFIDRIFDPFFTTKGVGKGTGLGLSTAMGIVKSHGGFLTVESKLGKGTTFRIHLPRAQSDAPAAVPAQPTAKRGTSELILVVDDEPAILVATNAVLVGQGYRVVTAPNGHAGQIVFDALQDQICLAVIDQMMPIMNGEALIAVIRAQKPSTKIIAVTGMSQADQASRLQSLGVSEVLLKPYTPQQLLEVVDRLIDRPSPVKG